MCVSSQSERSCSSRFNQRVYHCVFFLFSFSLSSTCLTAECSNAKSLLLAAWSVCVRVFRRMKTNTMYSMFFSFSSSSFWFALVFFSSSYILTYLKYTLNSLSKQLAKFSTLPVPFQPVKESFEHLLFLLTLTAAMSLFTMNRNLMKDRMEMFERNRRLLIRRWFQQTKEFREKPQMILDDDGTTAFQERMVTIDREKECVTRRRNRKQDQELNE